MTNENNAHAAASVATDATANATPAAATRHCCGDSSDCAGAATDPVELAAALRSQIETARDCLESAAIAYADTYFDDPRHGYDDWRPLFDNLVKASLVLRRLRKGAT